MNNEATKLTKEFIATLQIGDCIQFRNVGGQWSMAVTVILRNAELGFVKVAYSSGRTKRLLVVGEPIKRRGVIYGFTSIEVHRIHAAV
jgi:hypothetical protein